MPRCTCWMHQDLEARLLVASREGRISRTRYWWHLFAGTAPSDLDAEAVEANAAWDFAKAEEERDQSELSETLMKLGIQDHDAVARVLLREYVMTSKLPRHDGSRS